MRSPAIADPLGWRLCVREGEELRWIAVRLDGRVRDSDGPGVPARLADPLVAQVAGSPEAEAWRYFARVPWAWLEHGEDGVVRAVGLSDFRYQARPGPGWSTTIVPVDAAAQ
jgi:hypothetical protein